MNCDQFVGIVRDYARQEWLNGHDRAEAREHVSACAACRQRLDLELAYEGMLARAIASLTAEPAPAPPAIVLAAFRERQAARGRSNWKPLWVAIPIAAALLFALTGWWRWEHRPREQPVAQVPVGVGEFVPVRYGKPVEPGEFVQLIRIRMPKSELVRYGLPVTPDDASIAVSADIVLGEDGLAKAIRLVY